MFVILYFIFLKSPAANQQRGKWLREFPVGGLLLNILQNDLKLLSYAFISTLMRAQTWYHPWFPIPVGAGVSATCRLPSISHSYWISHPESLGKWGKSLFLNLLLNLEFKHLSGKRSLPWSRQMKIKQTPGGSWQEVKLTSPALTSLGLIRILFWKAAGLLWILSVNWLHWVRTPNHCGFKSPLGSLCVTKPFPWAEFWNKKEARDRWPWYSSMKSWLVK